MTLELTALLSRGAADLENVGTLLKTSIPRCCHGDGANLDANAITDLHAHAAQISLQMEEIAQDAAGLAAVLTMIEGGGA